MHKTLRITASLLAVAASFTLAGVAQAQSTSNNTNAAPYYRAGGSYFDFNAGKSDYSLSDGVGIWDKDDSDNAYSAHIGSYFNDNVGMELGYTDFGQISRAGGSTKARGISLSLVGKFPVSPSFNLLGKIGTTYSDTDTSANGFSGIQTGSEHGFGVNYGVGAEYAFTPKWSILLQYESHDLKFAGDNKERVDVTSLGVRYSY
ncbi:porin family protein [Rhodoferax sp. BLA1]|uniref:porin family protein n=1 Tax=Rhodoferax sp. BLA1 TaxID=2576062 RepID=UPI0015D153C3|nr:outer membrane beta-barrel protein [Rhodoferax sp. BLA1]